MKTIKSKLIFSISCVAIIILLFNSLGNYFVSKSSITKKEYSYLSELSEKSSVEINDWIDQKKEWLKSCADTYQFLLYDKQDKEIKEYLLNRLSKDNSESIMEAYYCKEGNITIMANGTPPEGFKCCERGWYKSAKAANDTIVTDPYIDVITGKMVITIATPFYDNNGAFSGVVGADIEITTLI